MLACVYSDKFYIGNDEIQNNTRDRERFSEVNFNIQHVLITSMLYISNAIDIFDDD